MPFLVVPPLPNLRVEIAFDSGFATAEGDRTWTDISAYVEGASSVDINYGRADELSTPDPNTCSLTLDNRDGRFTPAKASSPYFPNVKKGKPLRVTVTYGGVDYVRFTGYVNEWPLVWPDGSSAASTVTITASSRRARLGQTAPLTSAIRAAYLATGPEAYWPLDDDLVNSAGMSVFRDITNTPVNDKATQSLGGFFANVATGPQLNSGVLGPTDEGQLVKFPSQNNFALVGTYVNYVGGTGVTYVNTTGGYATIEAVARIAPTYRGDASISVIEVFDANFLQWIGITARDVSDAGFGTAVAGSFFVRDPITYALLENEGDGSLTLYDTATDGELHHYAFVLDSAGTVGKVYFDGLLIGTLSMANPITAPLTQVVLGVDSYRANVWIGHAATTDRALTAAEVLAHAAAATAATETVEERVVRVAGRIGVPPGEIDVETTIAAGLGPQSEAGRSAAEVIDEAAASTGGVLYDTREGHLALQARNHRYNLASSFTLDATTQEIEGDLTVTDDHRYTINTVEYSRSGSDEVASTIVDQGSIDDYGIFSQTYSVVAEQSTEVESFAQNILARYADPAPRVSTVSVDVTNTEATQRALLLAADIGSRFGIESLPAQAPTDPMYLFLEGYTESITATSHALTMNTTPADLGQDVFILDDPTYGVLDVDVLAY